MMWFRGTFPPPHSCTYPWGPRPSRPLSLIAHPQLTILTQVCSWNFAEFHHIICCSSRQGAKISTWANMRKSTRPNVPSPWGIWICWFCGNWVCSWGMFTRRIHSILIFNRFDLAIYYFSTLVRVLIVLMRVYGFFSEYVNWSVSPRILG